MRIVDTAFDVFLFRSVNSGLNVTASLLIPSPQGKTDQGLWWSPEAPRASFRVPEVKKTRLTPMDLEARLVCGGGGHSSCLGCSDALASLVLTRPPQLFHPFCRSRSLVECTHLPGLETCPLRTPPPSHTCPHGEAEGHSSADTVDLLQVCCNSAASAVSHWELRSPVKETPD